MKENKGKRAVKKGIRTIVFSAIGFLIVAAVLIITTVLYSRSVAELSDESINSLEEFYLHEITERNVNDLNTEFSKKMSLLQNAVSVFEENSLESNILVNDYIRMVSKINGLDTFGLVDEEGTVYTADQTCNITEFSGLSDVSSDRAFICVSENAKGENVFVISIPVKGKTYRRRNITSCFTMVSTEKIISVIQLQGQNNQCYCRLFTQNGENIVAVSGEFPDGSNLFDVYREKASFNKGFSLEKMINDWEEGNEGYTSYSIAESGDSYVYYQPVPGTDFVMTALMRQNIINTQISNVSDSLYSRSIHQLLVVIAVLIIVFWVMTIGVIRNRRMTYESEKNEALLRQEKNAADQKAELQEKLLDEERQIHRHDDILRILGEEYTSIFYVDLIENTAIPYRIPSHAGSQGVNLEVEYPFREEFERNMKNNVSEDDLDNILMFSDIEVIKARMRNSSSFTVPYKLKDNNDGIKYSLLRISKVEGEDELRHIIMGYSDIDEQTRWEHEKQHILKDALDQAESANRAKTQFLSNMSHDIRTPMNAVIGFTSLIRENISNQDKVLDYVDKIEASGTHLLSLINDILDMSRIESGRVAIEKSVCAVSHIMYEMNSIVQSEVKAGNLDFSIDSDSVIHDTVICDRLRLSQMLLNCISNAVKYTPSGGKIRISISETESETEGVSTYEFRIADTGIGMKKEFLEHIFEPFERERTSTVSGIQGTGLGLAITKSIADMMNSTIDVISEEGKGSEFIIRVPLEFTDERPENDLFDSIRELPEYRFDNMKILIAEDNALNQEITEEILHQAGIETETAENGLEAVGKVTASPAGTYDAVLMDIQMPLMDGYQAASAIRKLSDPEKASIPIIAMTANAFEEDRKNAIAAGMNAHVAKPIDTFKLFETLKRITDKK